AIVGGRGRMGSRMHRLFADAGHQVEIADTAVGPIAYESIAKHDVILLAVPIPAVEELMQALGPFTRPDAAVIDIASVKIAPIKAMLRHAKGEVIGSHPLFGPDTASLQDQIVFVCPARTQKWIVWYRDFLEGQGARVAEIDPDVHDELMAVVQVFRHMLLFCFGRTLMKMDFDLQSQLPVTGPWFSQLTEMLTCQLKQRPELYAELAAHNAATGHVVENFLAAAQEIAESYNGSDSSNLVGIIDDLSKYMLAEISPAESSSGQILRHSL
ncbi:MAG: prephenate dehydrogenase/arogenate dehydrogenase family protein, partial [Thermodesulfobacteriota bacterium]